MWDILLRVISQDITKAPTTKISLKITYQRFHQNLPGANEFNSTVLLLTGSYSMMSYRIVNRTSHDKRAARHGVCYLIAILDSSLALFVYIQHPNNYGIDDTAIGKNAIELTIWQDQFIICKMVELVNGFIEN